MVHDLMEKDFSSAGQDPAQEHPVILHPDIVIRGSDQRSVIFLELLQDLIIFRNRGIRPDIPRYWFYTADFLRSRHIPHFLYPLAVAAVQI